MNALERLNVTVVKPITIQADPVAQISYTPEPSVLTIRTIISAIASANSPPFNVSVYHPPTLEERARRIRLHERQSLLHRLAFAFIVVIPTFIIGIVYMTLVSRRDPTRMYLMTPVWAGRVSRAEWALFIMLCSTAPGPSTERASRKSERCGEREAKHLSGNASSALVA